MIDEQIWTCQICGRPIKAKNGIIAHHGYKRPGDGWQTTSCMGARFKPYEVSCDRIIPAIESVEKHINKTEEILTDYINNPPQIIKETIGGYYQRKEVEFTKPEGFDPINSPCCYNSLYGYSQSYFDRKKKLISNIKYSKQDLQYLKERLANWIPPKIEE